MHVSEPPRLPAVAVLRHFYPQVFHSAIVVQLTGCTPHFLLPRRLLILLLLWLQVCQVRLLVLYDRDAVIVVDYCVLQWYYIWQVLRQQPMLLSGRYILCVLLVVQVGYAAVDHSVIPPLCCHRVCLLYHKVPGCLHPWLLLLHVFIRCKVILITVLITNGIHIFIYNWCLFLHYTRICIIYRTLYILLSIIDIVIVRFFEHWWHQPRTGSLVNVGWQTEAFTRHCLNYWVRLCLLH